MKPRTTNIWLACLTTLIFNSACAQNEDETPAPEAAETTAAETAVPAPAPEQEKKASPGMQVPVDGSSLPAFEKSLAKIKEQSTEAEYTSLTNAIDYLLVYDLSANRNREKLAANLDGMTGEQIVDKVKWGKKKRR